MSRIDIPFVVEKQNITQPTREKLVAGGQNYFYATFTINEVWEDIKNAKAVFSTDNISKLIPLIETETGYECEIPWEVMANKGSFRVGIFGGDRMITDTTYVIVKEGCITDGESPTAPTPDWFEKIEEEVKDAKDAADSIDGLSASIGEISSQTEIIKSDVEGLQKQIQEEAHFRGYLSTNAKIQSLDATPNDFAYSAESGTKWIYDGVDGWQDSGTPVPDQLTPASDTTPLVNGVASAGKEEAYARGDHRHPTDTSRASVAELNALKTDMESVLDELHNYAQALINGGVA
jgi:hypothetical protein